jgi:uncharacterized protein Yka (UPF0111/DUF47 family)
MSEENGRATIREVYALIREVREEHRAELLALRSDIRAVERKVDNISVRLAMVAGAAGALSAVISIAVRFLT